LISQRCGQLEIEKLRAAFYAVVGDTGSESFFEARPNRRLVFCAI
jgi:hypothetical protein